MEAPRSGEAAAAAASTSGAPDTDNRPIVVLVIGARSRDRLGGWWEGAARARRVVGEWS
jgi:hypothetical protein